MSWDWLVVCFYCSLDQSDKATISEVSLTAEVKQPLDVQQIQLYLCWTICFDYICCRYTEIPCDKEKFPNMYANIGEIDNRMKW